TDSIQPTDAATSAHNIRVLSIAPLLAEAIARTAREESWWGLFYWGAAARPSSPRWRGPRARRHAGLDRGGAPSLSPESDRGADPREPPPLRPYPPPPTSSTNACAALVAYRSRCRSTKKCRRGSSNLTAASVPALSAVATTSRRRAV